MKYLDVPKGIKEDADAMELARIWTSGGDPHFSIRVDLWDDPAAWGIMLADIARHAAKSYSKTKKNSFTTALSRIVDGFNIEIQNPTADIKIK